MEGLVEVITSKELYDKGEIDLEELRSFMFQKKTVMRFRDLKSSLKFGVYFVHNYLIPKYGKKEMPEFPMAKSGPARSDAFEQALGLKEPNMNQETWLVIPTDRYHEIQEYTDSLDK